VANDVPKLRRQPLIEKNPISKSVRPRPEVLRRNMRTTQVCCGTGVCQTIGGPATITAARAREISPARDRVAIVFRDGS